MVLGLATLFYTWLPSGRVPKSDAVPTPAVQVERRERVKDSLRTAGFLGSVYWFAGLAAILYPNTAGTDPEFGDITDFPQGKMFPVFAGLAILGAWLETRRLR